MIRSRYLDERHAEATSNSPVQDVWSDRMPGRLLVFTRYPEPGRTKTRLIPALGAERAAAVHRSLATHTLRAVEDFRCDHDAIVEVWFAGGDTSAMRALFGERLIYQPQSDALSS